MFFIGSLTFGYYNRQSTEGLVVDTQVNENLNKLTM